MASPSRQIGDVSFVTNSNNNSYPKLFYTLKAGEIWKHWHCHLLYIVSACALCCGVCCTLVITALRSTATTPGQVRGGPGAARPKSWFHLTQHFRLWVNYISLSAQVGILCDFSTGTLPIRWWSFNVHRGVLLPATHVNCWSEFVCKIRLS